MQNQGKQSLINTRINTINNIYNEYTVAHNSYNAKVKIQVHRIIHNN